MLTFLSSHPKTSTISRTKDIDLKLCDLRQLRHEAEYYGISPLIKRLLLIEEMDHSGCGDLLFYCLLPAPSKSKNLKNPQKSDENSFQTFQFKTTPKQLSQLQAILNPQHHLELSFEHLQTHLDLKPKFLHVTLILTREPPHGIFESRATPATQEILRLI